MTGADYIVDFLINKGVTDAFGIPGGVILDFLYAMDRRKTELTPHLCYHEQGAAFAACGYAQAKGEIGVAYATRGPGITNMLTTIADAYYDSTPVLFITAHAQPIKETAMRIEMDQEFNPLPALTSITKYSARVEKLEDIPDMLERAYGLAITGRKGPVCLDFLSSLFTEKLELKVNKLFVTPANEQNNIQKIVECVRTHLLQAKRPIFLIGGGVRQSATSAILEQLVEKTQIPVLSSRLAQDIMPTSPLYFGFVGSHASRYSNFILSKADLIIAIGNRMSFPIKSQSFRAVMEHAVTIRIDVDETEFFREIPNSITFSINLCSILPAFIDTLGRNGRIEWLAICNQLRETLWCEDKGNPVDKIVQILKQVDSHEVITSDVGNHEFWVSHAYAYAKSINRILYSHSFGALGCSLPKAIGAYYATRQPVICFTGDQGIQMNIQELQHIVACQLPITIILLNNMSSGMIRSGEKRRFGSNYLHTTLDSGYSIPNFEAVAMGYGLRYFRLESTNDFTEIQKMKQPCFVELRIDETIDLIPSLPKGSPCQALQPNLPDTMYQYLDNL